MGERNSVSLLKLILGALSAIFGWLTKTGRTPEQKEEQAIRKQSAENHKKIDDLIDKP